MSDFKGKKAITFGVFDLLHYGHFELFRHIRDLVGDDGEVIVMLQKDEWVTKFKDVKLVYNFDQRKQMIETLRTVSKVLPYTQVDETIKTVDFDVAVFGPDQNHVGFQRAVAWTESQGKIVYRMSRTDGISSSQLRSGTQKDVI